MFVHVALFVMAPLCVCFVIVMSSCHKQLRVRCVGAILMQLCVCPLGGALEIVYQGIWLMRQQVYW